MFIRSTALPVIVGTILLTNASAVRAETAPRSVAASPVSAPAAPVTPNAYLITSLQGGATQGQVAQELLSIGTTGGQTLVRLQDGAGDAVIAPASVDVHGALHTAISDPGLTCYNVAIAVASEASARDKTSALFLSFGSETITVPLQLTSAASEASGTQTVNARGSTQTTVNAGTSGTNVTLTAVGTVTSMQGTLLAARFDETGTLTDTGTAVTRTSCTVVPLVRRAQPQPVTGAPAASI